MNDPEVEQARNRVAVSVARITENGASFVEDSVEFSTLEAEILFPLIDLHVLLVRSREFVVAVDVFYWNSEFIVPFGEIAVIAVSSISGVVEDESSKGSLTVSTLVLRLHYLLIPSTFI
jgi:hypothetical protein